MSLSAAQELIQNNVELPTLPQVIAKINALVDDPDVGVREIGAAVGEDAPTAAKVLKIANSAYFGLREKVVSTEHATAVLGIRMLRTVALQASVVRQYEHLRGNDGFNLESLWKHSIFTGQVCAALAQRCRGRIGLAPEEFHVIGLLHDMGKIILLEHKADMFLQVVRESRISGTPQHVLEDQNFGFHHGHVGALIAQAWGLPRAVSDAIQFHHGPREALIADPVAALVALVNLVVHRIEEHELERAVQVFDERSRALLGLREDDISEVVAQAELWLPQIQI